VYAQARAAAVWTLPSHTSLFTGLHPRQHGVNVENRFLNPAIPTLAGTLQQVGYQTAAFSTNAWVGPHFGLDRGFEHFLALWRIFPGMGKAKFPWWEKALRKRVLERHDKGARKLNKYVERWWRQERDPDRPFFLFGLYLDAHLPYKPPRGYAARLLQGEALHAARRANQDAWAYMAGEVAMSPQDFAGLRALYDAEIAYVDEQLGALLDFLDAAGGLDNTVIIVTADHGENIGDHELMDHQYCVYDSLARVPLLIHHPDHFPPGVDPAPVQHTDLFPTLLDLAGSPDLLALPGQSLFDLPLTTLQGDREGAPLPASSNPQSITQYTAPHRHRFARRHPHFDPASRGYDRTFDAIVQGDFKLIRSNRGDVELFDLLDDPGETTDLADSDPDTVSRLAAALDQWLRRHPPGRVAPPSADLDDGLVEHLRGLGYL
jgi:arylsulfatase A-like enzyme